jgi:hypothetical protein
MSSSAASSYDNQSSSPNPSRSLPRPFWFGAALLLFLFSSWIAFRQEPALDAYRQTSPLHADWWLTPVEFNAPQRLPQVWVDFNDVFALAGTGHVWAVGGGGLILHSADSGKHWSRQYLVDPNDPVGDKPISAPPPTPSKGAKAAGLRTEPTSLWRRLTPAPLESAVLLGLAIKSGPPSDPSQRPTDSKFQAATPPNKALDPNTGVSKQGVPLNNIDPASANSPGIPPDDVRVQKPTGSNGKRATNRTNRPANPAQAPPPSYSPPPPPAPLTEPEPTLRELASSDLNSVHFVDAEHGWIAGDNGALFQTLDGGQTWTRRDSGVGQLPIYGIFFYDSSRRWLTSDISKNPFIGLTKHFTRDGGVHWLSQESVSSSPGMDTKDSWWHYKPDNKASCLFYREGFPFQCLGRSAQDFSTKSGRIINGRWGARRSITSSDSQVFWIADVRGTLLNSKDGGQTWRRVTRELPKVPESADASQSYHVFPAPWYYLSLLVVGFLFVPALKSPQPRVVSESAADLLVSDSPISSGAADVFDFSAVALGLSRFLRNEKTVPPLTIAVTGEWGSGKSSLMNLLRADLGRYGFRPVWFNAWHHQKEENLLASLLEMVRSQAIPPWWRPEGAIFRLRLLKIRWSRLWPLIAILLIVFSFSFGYLRAHPDQIDKAWDFVKSFPLDPAKWFAEESHKMATGKEGDAKVPWFVFLLSSTGLLVSLWKGLKGFGVNPANLLARDSGRAKVRDLENLTGFRHRFAAEFRDITAALNPRTMLILIDDLDRCRPEMVLEVLESVNFLVSSGDCFVVLGMARERVVRCVGLGFKDVASELLTTDPRPEEKELPAEELARRRRIEFAQQYLEKLINIEVPVPSPTDAQSRRLMLAGGPPEGEPKESRGRRLWREVWPVIRKALPAASVILLLFLGYWLGATRTGRPQAAPQTAAAETASIGRFPVAPVAPITSALSPPPTGTIQGPARMEEGEEARLPLWLVALLLIVIVGLGVWRLSIPPGVVLRDSQEFETALATWHPLVFSFRNTPRSIKRFLNRVRYLAMLQREQSAEPARWQAALAWLLRRPVGRAEQGAAGNGHHTHIPEEVLVALAAIDHCHPEWLGNNEFFLAPQIVLAGQPLPDEIRAALLRTPLAPYREAYSRMSKGIHMS